MSADRRESRRFVPEKRTYVALRPHFSTLGKIIDISRGGLCFQYMAPAGQSRAAEALDMDLFIQDNGYYLPELHGRRVYETVQGQVTAEPVEIEYRKCGIQFGRLLPDQNARLEQFLQHHALVPGSGASGPSR